MGKERQQHYLEAFNALEPKAQQALKDIYYQAHQGGKEMGRHVVMAMVAAVRYPELFRFTLSNIVVRLMLKRFQLDKDLEKALQMQEVLDDFHVALDDFVKGDEVKAPQLELLNGERVHVVRDLWKFKDRAGTSIDRAKQVRKR